jgi:hypothetical protein
VAPRGILTVLFVAIVLQASCGDDQGELEITVQSDRCAPGPGPRLTTVGLLLAPSPASPSELPTSFLATFDACAQAEDAVIYQGTFEPAHQAHDVLVVAGLDEAGVRRSAEGCLEDLIVGAYGRSPCVLVQRLAYVEAHSVTRVSIDLEAGCRSSDCGDEACELFCR